MAAKSWPKVFAPFSPRTPQRLRRTFRKRSIVFERRRRREALAEDAQSHRVGPSFSTEVHGEERARTLEGYDFPSIMQRMAAEEKEPRSKAQIIHLLTTHGENLAKWMDGLPHDFLAEVVTILRVRRPPRGHALI